MAIRETPWLYEAMGLEGEILLAKSLESQVPGEAASLMGQAVGSLRAAQAIAPSDPPSATSERSSIISIASSVAITPRATSSRSASTRPASMPCLTKARR